MPPTDPSRELDLDVELAASAHQSLLADLDVALADGRLEVAAPSLLPDWTVGHVLTHIARSGDGHSRIFEAASRGEVVDQYPHGLVGRAADIEAGATRSAHEQVDDVRRSIWQLESRWASSSWTGAGRTPSAATVPLTDFPFLRAREVVIHRIDLGLGATFEELPSRYVRKELSRLEMQWKARQPMGMTSMPAAANAAPPPQRLAWLTGRGEIEGLGPADVF